MRHFGGGIGHLQSHCSQRAEQGISETGSISSSEDEEPNSSSGGGSGAHVVVRQDALDEDGDTEDMGSSDDSDSMESGGASDDDSEPELDSDDNGYDSL